jgi:hypothetical protein
MLVAACARGQDPEPAAERVASAKEAMVSGNMVSGNMVSGNMVSGNMVSGNMVRGDITAGYTAGTLFAKPIEVGAFVDGEGRKLIVVASADGKSATVDGAASALFSPEGEYDTNYETYFCYLIKGALDDSQQVTIKNRPGLSDRVCPGHIGINPSWLSVRGMTSEESLEMVAMMAAHSNDGHTTVPISARADWPTRISADLNEQMSYPVEEASFFLGVDENGNNEIQFCGGPSLENLIRIGHCTGEKFAKRFCTHSLWGGDTPCFHYLGPCRGAPPAGGGGLMPPTPGQGEAGPSSGPSQDLCEVVLDDGVTTVCHNDRRPGATSTTRAVFTVFLDDRVQCEVSID